jgi:hypothetical protein
MGGIYNDATDRAHYRCNLLCRCGRAMTAAYREVSWREALAVYLAGSTLLHLVWEIVQLPLYTIWTTGTDFEIAFAVVHCTAGDIIIAALSLLAAFGLLGDRTWPPQHWVLVIVATLGFGIAITIYSEWLNTTVRKTWAYSDLMPTVPILGTGLSPLLQWVVVPICVFVIVERCSRLKRDNTRS